MRLSGCQGLPGRRRGIGKAAADVLWPRPFSRKRQISRFHGKIPAKNRFCGSKPHQADADSALLIRYLRHLPETISAPPYRELSPPKTGKNRRNRELTGKSE